MIYDLSIERQIGDYQIRKGETLLVKEASFREAGIGIPSRILVWLESSMCHNYFVILSPKA